MAIGSDHYDSLKRRAHSIVKKAIKAGELEAPAMLDCADCGKTAYCYDHRDYNQPLDVVPVCQACNIKRGPAINAPADLARGKYLCETYRNPGYKPVDRNYLLHEEKIIDFPGHCVIDLDEDFYQFAISPCERFEFDHDVNVAFDILRTFPKKYRAVA